MQISAYSPVRNTYSGSIPKTPAKNSADSVHFGAKKEPCTEEDVEAKKMSDSVNSAIDNRDSRAMQNAITEFVNAKEEVQLKFLKQTDLFSVCIKRFGSKTTEFLFDSVKKIKSNTVKKALYEDPSCLRSSVSDFPAESVEYVLQFMGEAAKINPGAVAGWKQAGFLGGQIDSSWLKKYPNEIKGCLIGISKNIGKLPSKQAAMNFISNYWDIIREEN